MSMRVLEEKERLVETNDGDWKKDIEDRLHECHSSVLDMMIDLYGTQMEDFKDGLIERVKLLETKLNV
tara:strand:+ start:157 stop:360 length:204 start_codon:yes stop_codon:yes gene_type:complete